MYVIFPAVDVVDESYLALVAQENETPPATGLTRSRDPRAPPAAPPTFHDTRAEQERAEVLIALENASPEVELPRLTQLQPPTDRRARPDSFYYSAAEPALPDLVPANLPERLPANSGRLPDVSKREYLGKVSAVFPMAADQMTDAAPGRRLAVPIRDLIYPSLNETLKGQQQVTFRLVKSGKRISFFYACLKLAILACILPVLGLNWRDFTTKKGYLGLR